MIFGVKKCHMYLYVKCFILVRDHVHVSFQVLEVSDAEVCFLLTGITFC